MPQKSETGHSTQKPVDRSLTYELFGYNVSDEPEEYWTPDKLAVFLARKLGTQSSSPLKGKIAVSPKRDEALVALGQQAAWKVSTAVVVDAGVSTGGCGATGGADGCAADVVHVDVVGRVVGAGGIAPWDGAATTGGCTTTFMLGAGAGRLGAATICGCCWRNGPSP